MKPEILAKCWNIPAERAEKWAPVLTAAMLEFGIDTAVRQAAFLAQCGHESGCGRYTFELWGPTETQRGYEGRKDLGNTELGDGKRFRGRGLIMVTGRSNYALAGPPLGYDLIAMPTRLALPGPACRSAGWFWQSHRLNDLADVGDFDAMSDIINRGHKTQTIGDANGYADRLRLWKRATETLGVQ